MCNISIVVITLEMFLDNVRFWGMGVPKHEKLWDTLSIKYQSGALLKIVWINVKGTELGHFSDL